MLEEVKQLNSDQSGERGLTGAYFQGRDVCMAQMTPNMSLQSNVGLIVGSSDEN